MVELKDLVELRKKIDARKLANESIIAQNKETLAKYKEEITKNTEIVNRQQSLQKLINTYSTVLVSYYTKEVSDFINKVLKTIIPDYTHTIVLKEATSGQTNKTVIGIYKQIDGNPDSLQNLVKSSGGGICSIVSQILFIYFHLRFRKSTVSEISMDEQLSQLSLTYQPAMSQFLKYVSKQYKINVILTTHSPSLTRFSDNIFETRKGYVNEILGEDLESAEEDMELENESI